MDTQQLTKLQNDLPGKKVVVIDAIAFSMAICNVKTVEAGGGTLTLQVEGSDKSQFVLPEPVNAVATPTGFRLESTGGVLQVDYMPE